MIIRINISTENAAFEDCSGAEVARILKELAGRLDGEETQRYDCRPLRDSNGNRVGEYTVNGGAKKGRA